MGLFDQILSAVKSPDQQANPAQLGGIFDTVQQLAQSQGVNPAVTQTVMSIVGNHVRSSLQQQQVAGGSEQVQSIVNQFSGTTPSSAAVNTLFSPNQQQQVVNEAAQRTGVNPALIQAMLPIAVPLVLNLLQGGAANHPGQSSNPVLNTFLDTNHSGSVDMGDVVNLMGQFLKR